MTRFNHRAIVKALPRPLYWTHTGDSKAAAAARGKEGSSIMTNRTTAMRRRARRAEGRETAQDSLTRVFGAGRPPGAFPILGAFR